MVFAADRGCKKPEHGRFADDQRELLRRNVGLSTLLHPERRNTERFHRRLETRYGRHSRLDANVVGARRPAADPDAMAMPDPPGPVRPARPGDRDRTVTAPSGITPSTRMRETSARARSILIVPPTSAEPRLGIEIGTFASLDSVKRRSFAWRQP